MAGSFFGLLIVLLGYEGMILVEKRYPCCITALHWGIVWYNESFV